MNNLNITLFLKFVLDQPINIVSKDVVSQLRLSLMTSEEISEIEKQNEDNLIPVSCCLLIISLVNFRVLYLLVEVAKSCLILNSRAVFVLFLARFAFCLFWHGYYVAHTIYLFR